MNQQQRWEFWGYKDDKFDDALVELAEEVCMLL